MPGRDPECEVRQDLAPARVLEVDALEGHTAPAIVERRRRRVVAQGVGNEDRRDGFRQAGHVLGHVDDRHREIPRRVQDGEAEGGDEHDITRARFPAAPQKNRPGEEGDREGDGRHGVGEAHRFQIEKAAPPCHHFAADRLVEAVMLAAEPPEGPDERHVADDVDHFAIDGGRLVGEASVQGLALRSQTEQGAGHEDGHHGHACRHHHVDGREKGDGGQRGQAGWQDVPDGHVLHGEHGIGGRGDPARQCAGEAIEEIARRVPREIPEEIPAQVARDADEGVARDPAGQTPEQVVSHDQGDEDSEGAPDLAALARPVGQCIDQHLHGVLRADRACDGLDHGDEDGEVGQQARPDVTREKCEGSIDVLAQVVASHHEPVILSRPGRDFGEGLRCDGGNAR